MPLSLRSIDVSVFAVSCFESGESPVESWPIALTPAPSIDACCVSGGTAGVDWGTAAAACFLRFEGCFAGFFSGSATGSGGWLSTVTTGGFAPLDGGAGIGMAGASIGGGGG